jgi:Adenosine deaminase
MICCPSASSSERVTARLLDEEQCWLAVVSRDKRADGQFVFAVSSTGIYCRPSCPARRPRREHVSFFLSATAAEQAGHRPCRRCQPERAELVVPQADIVEQICRYIATHLDDALRLADLSMHFHLSPYYLQRIFKRIMGISPRQYVAACRMEQFKQRLRSGEAVTSALYNAGYQSSSRVYTNAPEHLGMTPAVYRQGGKGMCIRYTCVPCAFGYVLMAVTECGLAAVRIGDSVQSLVALLMYEYSAAEIVHAEAELAPWRERLLQLLREQSILHTVSFSLQAIAFQWMVWEALCPMLVR